MNDIVDRFVKSVNEMRHKVIEAGGRPNTIKVSRQAIEEMKLFGMDIEVVDSVVLPKGVDYMVIEDKDKII